MPSYKDTSTDTWYCKFYYTDRQGHKRQKLKRGFKRKKDSADWERQFLEQFAKNPDITFQALFLRYKDYITLRTKKNTDKTRISIINNHILPYFKDLVISQITPADIQIWQNTMLQKGLSDTYLKTINDYLVAIFNYAVQYVGLVDNPCIAKIGSSKAKQILFWTPEEYSLFAAACRKDLLYFTIFETLYYTGMREGELLALTLNDIDLACHTITVNKTYTKIKGVDVITEPKTTSSIRSIEIPAFLADELQNYLSHLYEPAADSRIFLISAQSIRNALKRYAGQAGIKQIKVHDIRHSHASLLINLGANPVLVANRLGHSSPDLTLRVYAHLFPKSQHDIVIKIKKYEK